MSIVVTAAGKSGYAGSEKTGTAMSGHASIYSFPFRLYSSEELDPIEVSHADGRHRVRVYSPLTVRESGMPLSPDVPFPRWPRFSWNPGIDSEDRVPPPRGASAKPASEMFYDALRVDVRGPESDSVQNAYIRDLLGWLRELTLQPWIGEYEPHTDTILKYGFRCDSDGRAIDAPWAHMKATTMSPWMTLLDDDSWREAVEQAAGPENPMPYWALFLDAQLQRAVNDVSQALLLMALALEVARDTHFPRFSPTTTKPGVGEVLEEPFGDTNLLSHLSSDLEEVHQDGRNLQRERPDEWQAVRKVYVARHHIAHGGPAVILEDEGDGVRPAEDDDVRTLSNLTHNSLRWIEAL